VPQQWKTIERSCTHRNPWEFRLITYTRYGAMVGCLQCGTSWLIRTTSSRPLPYSGNTSGDWRSKREGRTPTAQLQSD
jgi:hypothetical protein